MLTLHAPHVSFTAVAILIEQLVLLGNYDLANCLNHAPARCDLQIEWQSDPVQDSAKNEFDSMNRGLLWT